MSVDGTQSEYTEEAIASYISFDISFQSSHFLLKCEMISPSIREMILREKILRKNFEHIKPPHAIISEKPWCNSLIMAPAITIRKLPKYIYIFLNSEYSYYKVPLKDTRHRWKFAISVLYFYSEFFWNSIWISIYIFFKDTVVSESTVNK